jgi:hypothetical protein
LIGKHLFKKILLSLTKHKKKKDFPQRWILASKGLEKSFFSKPVSKENFYWFERNVNRLDKLFQKYTIKNLL